jgi:hypothetical protein
MNEEILKKELWNLDRELASLRFEYYELLTGNRTLAMKLFGYRSTYPEKFPIELTARMDFYLNAGRE